MTRLLKAAAWLCGDGAASQSIEPLLADWQRELDAARGQSGVSYSLAMADGSLALLRAVIACAITEGVWLPPLGGLTLALLAIAFSIAVSIAFLLSAPLSANLDIPRSLPEPMVQRYLLTMSGTVLPPAFMLGLFALRRDARATIRHAIVFTSIVAVSMTVLAVMTTQEALERRYMTFEFMEQMRARSLESQRAGRNVYPGTRYQKELATTVEERRARFDQFRARLAAMKQKDPPPTWSERLAQFSPVALAVMFAIMGWTLAGIGQPTFGRGVAWWALVFVAIVTMTGMLTMLVRVPMPRAPQLMLPLFSAIALLLAWHSRRHIPTGASR